jgi:hypothetical protein
VTYCIDTSSLIAAWNERYPIANVPGFWERFGQTVAGGLIVSPLEVRNEVRKKEDGLSDWLGECPRMFIELEHDVQLATKEVLGQFPWLTKGIAGRTIADPFVIALAKARSFTVVTEEGFGSISRPHIPLVCQHYGIPCINLLGLIQGEAWVF